MFPDGDGVVSDGGMVVVGTRCGVIDDDANDGGGDIGNSVGAVLRTT